MLFIRIWWPKFAYQWLIAAMGAWLAWPTMLLAYQEIPWGIELFSLQGNTLYPAWPSLLLDHLSWPYAVAMATLALAVIMTDVSRAPESDWSAWAGSLALAALGTVSVLSGNPLTLLLAWTVIDLVELVVMLTHVKENSIREKLVINLTGRFLGSGILVAAILTSSSMGQPLTFVAISSQASLLLLLAAGLRLGVIPLQSPFLQVLPLRRGLGTIARLVPAAPALMILSRTATATEGIALAPYLIAFAALAALYASGVWLFASDELVGRPVWLLGTASLAVAATILGQPLAVLAWGLAALFSGGLLFLSSTRDRRLSWILLFGLVGFSALPFSPTWNGVFIYEGNYYLSSVAFLLAHVLLMVGYIRHALRPGVSLDGSERWVWVIYPIGMAIMPITHYFIGYWTHPGLSDVSALGWFAGVVALGLTGLAVLYGRRITKVLIPLSNVVVEVFSLNWMYRLFWGFYRSSGRVIGFFSDIMEGEGGMLWALLFLVLLLSVLTRIGA